MPTMNVTIMTDGNGYFQFTDHVNPPGPFTIKVDISAKVLGPADTTAIGSVDIDAADGNPQNQSKDFVVSTDEKISLGTWRLDGADNIVVLSGHTDPIRANTELQVELEVTL